MILVNEFYRVSEIVFENNTLFKTQIEFNATHPILAAHFPNQPIVPGACLVQISKEILEQTLKNKITILNFKSLKFIKTIDPNQFPSVQFTFSITTKENNLNTQISIGSENIVFGKLEFQYILSHD